MTFSRNSSLGRFASPLALAAMAGVVSVAWQAPAAAQRASGAVSRSADRDKDKDKGQQQAQSTAKAKYSKEFIAAYNPVEKAANAPGADLSTLKPQLPAIAAAASTPDDRSAAGRLIYNVGVQSKDPALQLQGAEMMIASGVSDPAQIGQLNYVAAQLAFNAKDYTKSRTYAESAIKAGYTQNDPELMIAEGYFAQNQNAPGLKYISDAIAARKAAGQPVPEAWVKRALATAYNAKMVNEANQWAIVYARDYPSQTSWGDAISIAINNGNYAAPEMLDLLRLARKTDTIRTRSLYLEYVDAADARKLPSEVIQVLDAGTSAKLLDASIPTVRDARTVATARLATDRTELPALQRDANAAGAKLVTVMAAADTLLSYGKYAEAEALYAKAAAMPGANVPLVLTRQGIAQVEQGKFAPAQATLAKVTGVRQPIANLWTVYAAQKGGGAAATTAVATTG